MRSGARGRYGGETRAPVRESLEKHWFEEAAVAKRFDQKVAPSLVLEDFDAAAAGDALGVEEVEGIVGADVDLVSGLARGSREDVEEIQSHGTAIGCTCLVQGVDLLGPARVSGQPPVFGVEEGLWRKGDYFVSTAARAEGKRGEAAG